MKLEMKKEMQEQNGWVRVEVIGSAPDSYLVEFDNVLYKVAPDYVTAVNPGQLSRVDSIDTVIMEPEIFSRRRDIPKSYDEVMLFSAIREHVRRKAYDDPQDIQEVVEKDEALYVGWFKDKDKFLHFRRQLRGSEEFLQRFYAVAGSAVWSFICDQLETKYDAAKHSAGGFSGGAFMGGFYDTSWQVSWMKDDVKDRVAARVALDPVLRELYEKDGKVNSLGRGLLRKTRAYVNRDDASAFGLAQERLRKAERACMKFVDSEEERGADYRAFRFSIGSWVRVIQDGIQQGLNPVLKGTKTCTDVQGRLEKLREIRSSQKHSEE